MGKLEEFFKLVTREEQKKSDLEILDEIEGHLKEGNLDMAVLKLRDIRKDHNLFLALRMILRELSSLAMKSQETSSNGSDVRVKLREVTLLANTIPNPLQRSVLLSDLAVIFYHLGDDLNGDMAIKAAIDLASNHPNILKEVIMNLVNQNLLEKAAYAMKLVKNPEKLDMILAQLAEKFYMENEIEKATAVLKHMTTPFHKAMALYSIASMISERDIEEAKKVLDVAFRIAEKIEDPASRFEINMKLYSLKSKLEGEKINLEEILEESDNS